MGAQSKGRGAEEVALGTDGNVNRFLIRSALTMENKLRYIAGLNDENWGLVGITCAEELVKSQIVPDTYHENEILRIGSEMTKLCSLRPDDQARKEGGGYTPQ